MFSVVTKSLISPMRPLVAMPAFPRGKPYRTNILLPSLGGRCHAVTDEGTRFGKDEMGAQINVYGRSWRRTNIVGDGLSDVPKSKEKMSV